MEHIYELRYLDGRQWHTFYVGRTKDIPGRLSGHKSASKKGTTDVYCFIRDLEFVNIKWNIFSALTFNEYTGQEDEHILSLLFKDIDLMNMKKGDAKWKERTLANMGKAKAAGCKSVKEYQDWDRIQRQKVRDAKAAKRLEEEEKYNNFQLALALHAEEAKVNQEKINAIINPAVDDVMTRINRSTELYPLLPDEKFNDISKEGAPPCLNSFDSRDEYIKARDEHEN